MLWTAVDGSRPGAYLDRLAPALKRVRFLATGISFGDQAKFFRREALQVQNSFPAIKPIEDIALSLCMKETGATVFIPGGVVGISRKPTAAGSWADFMKALYGMIRYLTLRRLGLAK